MITIFVGGIPTRRHISYTDTNAHQTCAPAGIRYSSHRSHCAKKYQPGDSVDCGKDHQGNDTTLILRTNGTNRNPSSIFNPIPLTSGDGSGFGHYRAKIIALRLRVVSVSGGLPSRVPDIWREGTQTKRSEL